MADKHNMETNKMLTEINEHEMNSSACDVKDVSRLRLG